MPSRATALFIACATSALAIEAQAMGFGRLTASAVLGQPLSLPVPLRLDPGERLAPECVAAEVTAGDTAIHRDHIRVRLEPGASASEWLARITTQVAIDEPVIEITLTIGCDKRFSRRFVAFADPPLTQARSAPIELDSVPPPAVGVVAGEAGPVAEVPPQAPKPARGAATSRRTQEGGLTASPTGASTAKATRTAKVNRRDMAPNKSASKAAARAVAPAAAPLNEGARLVLEHDGPRLKLDMEEPIFMPPGSSAVGVAHAPEAEAGTVSEADRLRVLEKALSDLQRESQAGRDAAGALRSRLAEAENRSRAVPWLAALVLLSLGVAAWLALRVRRQHEASEVPPHWWTAEAGPAVVEEKPAPAGPAAQPELTLSDFGGFDEHKEASDTAPLPATLAMERDLPAHPAVVTSRTPATVPAIALRPESIYERTMVISSPPPFRVKEAAPSEPAVREVSVEELLDLEQQADFFIALGQEEAAIDLLMAHLRSTGGLSPLPYTKLLEIYRRQGDRDAYERIRTRFNRRFNAYAPEWEDGPLSGRALEDYPEVVHHLQTLWPEPLDAMAMLEAMLFRKDAAYELFDLPAYKDVLVLYALARDLLQQGGGRTAGVDVLLPLGDDAAAQEVQATVEPAGPAAEVPHFEMTAFALPPQHGQPGATAAGQSASEDAGPADTEPTLDPARRRSN
jgi:pilus assembly protein FimV